jgi:excisionase family DNA binding protein
MLRDPENNNSNVTPSPWLRPEEAANYLGVALGTLRNWTSARYVPFARRGRVVRYHRDTLDDWLADGAVPGRYTLADMDAIKKPSLGNRRNP